MGLPPARATAYGQTSPVLLSPKARSGRLTGMAAASNCVGGAVMSRARHAGMAPSASECGGGIAGARSRVQHERPIGWWRMCGKCPVPIARVAAN